MKEHVCLSVYTHIYAHIHICVLVNGGQSLWELEKTDDVLAQSDVTNYKIMRQSFLWGSDLLQKAFWTDSDGVNEFAEVLVLT